MTSLHNASSDDQIGMTSSNVGTSSGEVTLLGILGILGFVVSDHGYDSSMSTFKVRCLFFFFFFFFY